MRSTTLVTWFESLDMRPELGVRWLAVELEHDIVDGCLALVAAVNGWFSNLCYPSPSSWFCG
jgi:hypothetical protein